MFDLLRAKILARLVESKSVSVEQIDDVAQKLNLAQRAAPF